VRRARSSSGCRTAYAAAVCGGCATSSGSDGSAASVAGLHAAASAAAATSGGDAALAAAALAEMSLGYRCGVLIGRALRLGACDPWSSFVRGVQVTSLVVVGGAIGVSTYVVQAGWFAPNLGGVNGDNSLSSAQELLAGFINRGTHRLAGSLDSYNQCHVDGTVNGVRFTFLVDTGASSLAFNRDHMRQLGINAAALHYNQSIDTANGTGHAASIVVSELNIGGFVLRDVPADVDYAGASVPLIGMSVMKFMQLVIGRSGCELRW
jgi:clan AA aspartic protease (TIGR02281 family)